MNSKLAKDMSKDEKTRLVKELAGNNDLKTLHDQYDHLYNDNFSINKWGNAQFFNFKEGKPWLFNPTYKINAKKDKYQMKSQPFNISYLASLS